MNDIIPLVLGAAAATLLVAAATRPAAPVREDFWGLPNRTVRRHQVVVKDNVAYGILPTPATEAASKIAGLRAIRSDPASRGNFNAADYPVSFQGDVREHYKAQQPNVLTNCRSIKDFQDSAMDGYHRASSVNEIPIVYDRLIYANQKSRLAGLGDPIRGDLPIEPINDGWFRPSVAPNIDLRQGAINVIAGADNGTSKCLRDLQMEHSGKTALSNQNISQEHASSAVVVTAYP